MRRIRSKFSYANVISTLCLFMLLGGGAYAAVKLGKNSVGTRELKNSSVTGKKVRDGSILRRDLSTPLAATVASVSGSSDDSGIPKTPITLSGDATWTGSASSSEIMLGTARISTTDSNCFSVVAISDNADFVGNFAVSPIDPTAADAFPVGMLDGAAGHALSATVSSSKDGIGSDHCTPPPDVTMRAVVVRIP